MLVGGGKKRELVYSMMVRPKGFADCKLNQDPNSRMEPWDVLSPEGDMRVPLCKIKGTKEEIRQHLLQQVDELLESLDNCEGEFSPPIDDGWRLWSNAKPCGNVETHSQFTPVSDL